MLSVKEAAKQMGVSAATVYALCALNRLRHSRAGLGRGKIVISEEAVADYLRSRERGPALQPIPVRRTLRLDHLVIPS